MIGYNWTTFFDDRTQEQGKKLRESGALSHYESKLLRDAGEVSADVRDGGSAYHVGVELERFQDSWCISSLQCTCGKGPLCRHCAAVIGNIRVPHGRLYGAVIQDGKHYGLSEDPKKPAEKPVPKKQLPAADGLQALQEAQQKERLEAAEDGTGTSYRQDDQYQYFYPSDYDAGVHVSARVKNDAFRVQRAEVSPQIEVHYFESDAEKKQGVLGRFTCSFRSDGITAYLEAGQHRIVRAGCNDWACYGLNREDSHGRLTLCPHTLVIFNHLKKYLPDSGLGCSTNLAGLNLLKNIPGGGTDLTERGDFQHDVLHLEPLLNIRGERDYDFSMGFKVGTARLYRVRDIDDFVDAMEKEKDETFGKTTMHLGRTFLDAEGEKWFDLISQVVSEERGRMRRNDLYYYDVPRKNEIDLFGERLDRFLEPLVGGDINAAFLEPGGRIMYRTTLAVVEKDPDIHLEIHADRDSVRGSFDGVVITGKVPWIVQGRRYGYYIEDTRLCRVSETCTRNLQALLQNQEDENILIRIGRADLGRFYHKILPSLKKIADVTEYDTSEIAAYLPPEPAFSIYLDTENDTVLCRAEAAYGLQILSVSDLLDEKRGVRMFENYRDRQEEETVLSTIQKYLPEYDTGMKVFFCYRDDEKLFDLLNEGLDAFLALKNTDVHMTDRFRRLGLRRHVRFDVGVSMDSGLLDLSVTAQELSEEEMLDVLYQYQKKRKFIRLKNGDFLKVQGNESVGQIEQIMESLHMNVKDFVKGKMHLPAYRALYLDRMLEGSQDIYADRDRRFKQLIKEFKTVNDADFEVPESLKSTMRGYQKDGYRWLRTLDRYGFGGILADEMGLGKTLQTIAVLLAVSQEQKDSAESGKKEEADPSVSLVVCPASLVFNWGQELLRFAPSLRTVLVTGTLSERKKSIQEADRADVLVTSYDVLKRDIDLYDSIHFRFEIIDEAQYIKNQSTAAAKAVKIIHAKTRFALTGTPIENRLSELWSIFDYLMPGFLYDYSEFRTSFEIPIVKNEDENAGERLRRMVQPFILRRKKEDVLKDLPDKLEETRYADMFPKQRELYDAQVIRMRNHIQAQDEKDFRKSRIEILAELTKIRQLCCDPLLCYTGYDGGSAKKDVCLDLVDSLVDGGHKALLFSQFTSMLELLEVELKKRGISYYKITGATPKKKRLDLVNAFNEDDTPLFLISLKAGGTGLNLTGADVVIHYDPWWNTAAQDQATDRAHRIGQTKIVTVYKLIVKGTIEEKIQQMQEKKRALADEILSGEEIGSTTITREDLLAMLE